MEGPQGPEWLKGSNPCRAPTMTKPFSKLQTSKSVLSSRPASPLCNRQNHRWPYLKLALVNLFQPLVPVPSIRDEAKLSAIQKDNAPLYRAYLLKESLLRLLDAPDRQQAEAEARGWPSWASHSSLRPFVRLAKTIRRHLDGALLAIQFGVTNPRLEGTNNRIPMLSHRAFGFHSAQALTATIYLCCSGIQLQIPHLI